LQNRQLKLASDGTATRCYGYVADATVGLLGALLSSHDGEAFNIGAEQPECTMLQLASATAELLGLGPPQTSETTLPAHLAGAPHRSCGDMSKARRMLGYESTIPFEEGLRRIIDWHQARLAGVAR
jgi:nucleoside-diphosphate-sugar epimerase